MTTTYTTPIPPSTSWTLQFKFHKLSLVLPIDPTTPFPQIRSQIYTILNSTPNLTANTGFPPPETEEEIEFAVLDGASGQPMKVDVDDGGTVKVEKTATKRNCAKGLGLKEGGIVIMRWGDAVQDEEWPFRIPTFDEDDGAEQQLQQDMGVEVAVNGNGTKGKGRR